jgi:hypothetical protein
MQAASSRLYIPNEDKAAPGRTWNRPSVVWRMNDVEFWAAVFAVNAGRVPKELEVKVRWK